MKDIDLLLDKINRHKNWYHQVEVAPGVITPGINNSYGVLENLELPGDCRGLRALDLGTRDGFFAFELEKRGAEEVIAIDHISPEKTGFLILKEIFGSKVQYYQDNVYNLSKEKYGEFDLVLCLGLLYHLRDPLLALNRVREVCRNELYVESFIIDDHFINNKELLNIPIMQFYPTNELSGNFTNWWGPNSICLLKMLEATNFTVTLTKITGDRAIFKCKINEDTKVKYFREIEKATF
jgi:tRNA (mo5U34)-methyltransferase